MMLVKAKSGHAIIAVGADANRAPTTPPVCVREKE